MKEQELTAFLHSRYGFLLMLAASMAGTVTAYFAGDISPLTGNTGFGLPSANEWITGRGLSLGINLALNLGIAGTMLYMNRRFNIIRSVSMLLAGMFLIMQGALPSLMGQLYDGTLICFVVMLAVIPFFTTFQRTERTRRIFLSFCLLSFGSLTDYAYAAYILAFLIGTFQMQCFTFRGLLASLIGIIVPYWIMWGFGIISPDSFAMPEFVSIFKALDTREIALILVYTGVNLFLGMGFGIFNVIKIYGYNSRTRAYNGFWIVLSLVTVLLVIADYSHLVIYLPMLNCCTAIQIGHFFTINNMLRSYIGILSVIAIYVMLYIWNIAI
ncbi:MAG TPA: hypothetical protein PK430_09915 [Muribaculum sp.]|uniref:DUF998 domain-containing protein n=1 Tax=Heminiphilus faecis TaxID=2601703 RepID=A0ABV4CXN3_9BACT|nr:hypothetical protein [Heminiphilus faecis]HRF69523.1 hypothetical protein [Muribaculum sp.]